MLKLYIAIITKKDKNTVAAKMETKPPQLWCFFISDTPYISAPDSSPESCFQFKDAAYFSSVMVSTGGTSKLNTAYLSGEMPFS